MSKLTKAQREILQECYDDERGMTGVVQNYPPARIMVSRGLAVWLRDDPFSERLIITPEGRLAVEAGK